MTDIDILNFSYPKIKPRQKWLEEWWKKNTNTFLYALENDEIQKAISEYRKYALNDEIGKSPEEIKTILKRVLLKWCEDGRDITKLKYKGFSVKKIDDDYYIESFNQNNNDISYGLLDNPFRIFDSDQILKPEAKLELIELLSDPLHNSWIFEPRYAINEETLVYPTSHNIINTLHGLPFMRPLDINILGRYNLDYFIFWPMFFYYALTDDVEYVLKNVNFLHYPVKLFLIEDGWHEVLNFRLYGNCNFNEISNFIEDNKKELTKINKLMGVQEINSGEIRDYYIYKISNLINDKVELVVELIKQKLLKNRSENIKVKSYKEILKDAAFRDKNYRNNSKETRESFRREISLVKVLISQVKREIKSFNKINKVKNLEEIRKLIDLINKY